MALKNPYKKGGMFEGALHLVFQNAKQLRKNMTEAESILWVYLKTGINGYKFRRQHPIANYIADFFSYTARLVIELDGAIHLKEHIRTNDIKRQGKLKQMGYMVIRFTNDEVLYKTETVLKKISDIINNIIQNKLQKSEC